MRTLLLTACLLFTACLSGCMTTFQALEGEGPAVMGGTRSWLGSEARPGRLIPKDLCAGPREDAGGLQQVYMGNLSGLAPLIITTMIIDFPLSLGADLLLLPVSIPNEVYRTYAD